MKQAFRARRVPALSLAIAAMCAAPTVSAVTVTPNGHGQVLIYPYYTVNAGNQTLISVVNTTPKVKATAVRVREARNGRMVMSFNLYLGPYDTWTAAIYDPSNQAAAAANLISIDRSCTVPTVFNGQIARPIAFRNFAFSGTNADHPSTQAPTLSSLARTREGYVEIFELGELQTGTGALQLAEEATQNAQGVPGNCAALVDAWTPGGFDNNWAANPAQAVDLPQGGLYGTAQIVDVAKGTMVSYTATALSDFYTNDLAPSGLNAAPANRPTLAEANNGNGIARASLTLSSGQTRVENFPTTRAIDAVSLALMQTSVRNDYVLESALAAATEWVVTLPTKWHYVDTAAAEQVQPPFSDPFRDNGESRDRLRMHIYNREGFERNDVFCAPLDPQCGDPNSVEVGGSANVLVLRDALDDTLRPLFGAEIGQTARQVPTHGLTAGWAEARFIATSTATPAPSLVGPTSGQRYLGLPAIGFAATRFVNGAAQPGRIADYGGDASHRGTLEIGN